MEGGRRRRNAAGAAGGEGMMDGLRRVGGAVRRSRGGAGEVGRAVLGAAVAEPACLPASGARRWRGCFSVFLFEC